MASAADLTVAYRRGSLVLRAQTLRDLQRIWPQLRYSDLDASFPSFLTSTRLLVQRDRARASGLASSYVRGVRFAQGVPGDATVVLADPVPTAQVEASMHTTSVAAVKRATSKGIGAGAAMENAFVMTSGSVARLVLDAGRQTVMRSVLRDTRGKGWERVAGGAACRFCLMLAGRGSVYTEESVDFRSHDHCACSAMPVYV
jgi:hypothetical protein